MFKVIHVPTHASPNSHALTQTLSTTFSKRSFWILASYRCNVQKATIQKIGCHVQCTYTELKEPPLLGWNCNYISQQILCHVMLYCVYSDFTERILYEMEQVLGGLNALPLRNEITPGKFDQICRSVNLFIFNLSVWGTLGCWKSKCAAAPRLNSDEYA